MSAKSITSKEVDIIRRNLEGSIISELRFLATADSMEKMDKDTRIAYHDAQSKLRDAAVSLGVVHHYLTTKEGSK